MIIFILWIKSVLDFNCIWECIVVIICIVMILNAIPIKVLDLVNYQKSE